MYMYICIYQYTYITLQNVLLWRCSRFPTMFANMVNLARLRICSFRHGPSFVRAFLIHKYVLLAASDLHCARVSRSPSLIRAGYGQFFQKYATLPRPPFSMSSWRCCHSCSSGAAR